MGTQSEWALCSKCQVDFYYPNQSVSVCAAGGTHSASGSFNYSLPFSGTLGGVQISSFTPTDGTAGTTVSLTGSGFTGASAVKFNGTAANGYVVNSDTSISATVPTGATLGAISVVTSGSTGSTSGAGFFPDNWTDNTGQGLHTVGTYRWETNEYNSTAAMTVALDLGTANSFRIIQSSLNTPTGGSPAAYPSFWVGNSWGMTTPSNPFPLEVSTITGGGVVSSTFSIDTSLNTSSTDIYDLAYDIFFTPTSTGNQTGTEKELMVWLDWQGVSPGGLVTSSATVGGVSYSLYNDSATAWYLCNTTVDTLTIDVGLFAADMISRGLVTTTGSAMDGTWYLIDVQCGIEAWIGAQGLTGTSFSVTA